MSFPADGSSILSRSRRKLVKELSSKRKDIKLSDLLVGETAPRYPALMPWLCLLSAPHRLLGSWTLGDVVQRVCVTSSAPQPTQELDNERTLFSD